MSDKQRYAGNNHVIGPGIHISVCNETFVLKHNGKEWHTEWHHYGFATKPPDETISDEMKRNRTATKKGRAIARPTSFGYCLSESTKESCDRSISFFTVSNSFGVSLVRSRTSSTLPPGKGNEINGPVSFPQATAGEELPTLVLRVRMFIIRWIVDREMERKGQPSLTFAGENSAAQSQRQDSIRLSA